MLNADDDIFLDEIAELAKHAQEVESIENMVNQKVDSSDFRRSSFPYIKYLFLLIPLTLVIAYVTYLKWDSGEKEVIIAAKSIENQVALQNNTEQQGILASDSLDNYKEIEQSKLNFIEKVENINAKIDGCEIAIENKNSNSVPVALITFSNKQLSSNKLRDIIYNALSENNCKINFGNLTAESLKIESNNRNKKAFSFIFSGRLSGNETHLEIELRYKPLSSVQQIEESYVMFYNVVNSTIKEYLAYQN